VVVPGRIQDRLGPPAVPPAGVFGWLQTPPPKTAFEGSFCKETTITRRRPPTTSWFRQSPRTIAFCSFAGRRFVAYLALPVRANGGGGPGVERGPSLFFVLRWDVERSVRP